MNISLLAPKTCEILSRQIAIFNTIYIIYINIQRRIFKNLWNLSLTHLHHFVSYVPLIHCTPLYSQSLLHDVFSYSYMGTVCSPCIIPTSCIHTMFVSMHLRDISFVGCCAVHLVDFVCVRCITLVAGFIVTLPRLLLHASLYVYLWPCCTVGGNGGSPKPSYISRVR
jgi:hypothetical protein